MNELKTGRQLLALYFYFLKEKRKTHIFSATIDARLSETIRVGSISSEQIDSFYARSQLLAKEK